MFGFQNIFWNPNQFFFPKNIVLQQTQGVFLQQFIPVFFLLSKISPNFDLKNMVSPYPKDFSWKK
jgi:hypothetical protein